MARNPFEKDQQPEIVEQARGLLGKLSGFSAWIIVLVVIGFYAAGGIYQVGPSEMALVKRFGAHVGTAGPGLRYHLPAPIESVVIVPVTEIQKIEIGFRTINPPPNPRYETREEEALMLTGKKANRNNGGSSAESGTDGTIETGEIDTRPIDTDGDRITVGNNLVIVECVVQYQVKDAADFVFNIINPRELVQMAAEAVLREEVAKRTLDEVLTTERNAIGQDVQEKLQILLDSYEAGIDVVNVKLQDTLPPDPVADAFDDVNSARQDRETTIEQANQHRNQVVPEAEGEAEQIKNAAEGYKQSKIAQANGDVALFNSVLNEFNIGDPSVTMTRLYIEMMEDVLPNLNVLILPDGDDGTLRLLDLTTLLRNQQNGGNNE